MSEDRKLLEPLSTVVSTGLRLLAVLIVAGVALGLLSNFQLGWNGGSVCVTDEGRGGSSEGIDTLFPAADGAQVNAVPKYCATEPSGDQRLLVALGSAPQLALLLGGLFLLNRLLREATRDGVYTLRTASRLRVLGWWLLGGSLIAEAAQGVAQAILLADLAADTPPAAGAWVNMWSTPYLAILTSLGILTFARITRAGAAMREDLEGTV